MRSLRLWMVLLLLVLSSKNGFSQEIDSLNKHESWKYSLMGQLWLRHTELNQGSLVGGKEVGYMTDASLRRVRATLGGPISEKFYVFALMGQNNLNTINKESYIKLLDLVVEYEWNDHLFLGAGKTGYTGPSRYASPSSYRILGSDLIISAMTTINVTDDLLRKYSAYIKGDMGKFRHRTVLTRPNTLSTNTLGESAEFAAGYPEWQFSGYYEWQFLEKESMRSPYHAGTHLGEKKVFNMGFGFLNQSRAMWSTTSMDTTYEDLLILSADLFMELPLTNRGEKSHWITSYLGYQKAQYGKKYLRMVGANQMADGYNGSLLNGKGNSFPMMGTGETLWLQLGYLKPWVWDDKTYQLQPYYSAQLSRFDALNDWVYHYDVGINLYLQGIQSRFTLGYQSRPAFISSEQDMGLSRLVDRNYQWVLQYQFIVKGSR